MPGKLCALIAVEDPLGERNGGQEGNFWYGIESESKIESGKILKSKRLIHSN